jgi:hypothetical protein
MAYCSTYIQLQIQIHIQLSQDSSMANQGIRILVGIGIFVVLCETLRMCTFVSSSESMTNSLSFSAPPVSPPLSTSSYQLALKESFGFFDDITDENWRYRQSLARKRQDHASAKAMKETRPAFWYVSNYYPSFSCPNLLRVGGSGDGPKYVCDVQRLAKQSKCLIYSFGCKNKFEFEDGLIDEIGTVCEIHAFDPLPLPAGRAEELAKTKNIHFHHWGIASSYEKDKYKGRGRFQKEKFLTLQDTMKELGHINRTIDIFKIDCEGCEWSGYKDWLSADIRQLLIETHDLHANTLDFFDDLIDAGFNIVSREPNILPFVTKNNNMALEWSLLRLDPAFSGGRTKRLN